MLSKKAGIVKKDAPSKIVDLGVVSEMMAKNRS